VPAANLAAWRTQREKQLTRLTAEISQRVMAAQLRLVNPVDRLTGGPVDR
jgi:hypothetical protein